MKDTIHESKFEKDIFTNEKEYFFTMLSERFDYATTIWKQALEKQFHKKFEPILVTPTKFNRYFSKKNRIVLNDRLARIQQDTGKIKFIVPTEYENTNEEFVNSQFVKKLINKLIEKQDRVFVLPFSTSNLFFENKKIIVLGPKAKIATKFDDKVEQIKLFQKLNLPRNKVTIFANFKQLTEKTKKFPIFASAAFSSGGHESGIIKRKKDLDNLYPYLRSINRNRACFAANFIEDVALSPNTNAIVLEKNKTVVNCVSDQILRGIQYLGNIYPSKISPQQETKLIHTTEKVGNYLSRQGFRGIFGLDFLIDSKGKIYTVDLNPRRQGGYLCHLLTAQQNNISLVDLELRSYLNQNSPNITYKDFQVNFAWSHSKLKPHSTGTQIVHAFQTNNPQDPFKTIGKFYSTTFYPKKYILAFGNGGYYIRTGNSRKKVVTTLQDEVEKILQESFLPTHWQKYFDNPRTNNLLQ